MGNFYDSDLGVSGMSRDDLNQIALAGGYVGGIGYGYACRGALPRERHGYGFRWIATGGMGNCGSLVLTPRSKEAAEYLRQGKVQQIIADHGLDYADADAMYSATRGVRFGLEPMVLAYAIQTRDCRPAWDHFPGVGGGVWRWFSEWRMPETELSAPRLSAVAEILKKWA